MQQEVERKKQNVDSEQTSRLIVFNVPKYFTEKKLADHFREKGTITDCKIMRKDNKTRKFAFLGFKNEKDAKVAKEYFDQSYIDTGKLKLFSYFSSDFCGVCKNSARSKFTKGLV